MANKVICGNCGEELEVKDNLGIIVCEYCGSRLLLNDENFNMIKTKGKTLKDMEEDEELEDEEDEELEDEELEDEEWNAEKSIMAGKIVAIVFLSIAIVCCVIAASILAGFKLYVSTIIIGFIALPVVLYLISITLSSKSQKSDIIVIKKSLVRFEGLHFKDLKKMYADEGFIDITVLPSMQTFSKSVGENNVVGNNVKGLVLEVLINDREVEAGDTFRMDDKVIIKYIK